MANDFIPSAPAYLSEEISKKWVATATREFARLSASDPNSDPGALQVAALKKANELLVVAAPQSAKDILALEDWQVLQRGTRMNSAGVGEVFVVTTDGSKYVFPADKTPAGKK